MSHDTTQGAIRPQSAPSTTSADTSRDFRWIREQTVIKRVRRKLAERNHSLLITRAGTAARRELGRFAVVGERHEVLGTNFEIEELARALGALDDDERIELPPRVRRYYVARHIVEEADGGQRIHFNHRLTRDYTALDAAQRAAARFDGDGVAIVSYSPFTGHADRQEGEHDAL